jgi:hypothetical protein
MEKVLQKQCSQWITVCMTILTFILLPSVNTMEKYQEWFKDNFPLLYPNK